MTISFDRVAEIYDESRSIPPDAMKRTVEILADELKGYTTVLDTGAGTGRYAKPLQDKGFQVVGLDIASKMLRKAIEKGTCSLLRGDACNLPFKDSTFNVTISVSLLHLVKDWKKALQEIARVTRDLLVSVVRKNPNPLSKDYSELLEKFGYTRQRRGMSEWELKDIIEPVKSIPGPAYDTSIKACLKHLSQKAYSRQWDVPEDVHRQVMRAVRKKSVGGTFRREVEILIWDTNILGEAFSVR